MPIIIPDYKNGRRDWWRLLKAIFDDIAAQVNSLVISAVTADSFFGKNVQTITVSTPLSTLANVQRIRANNPGLALTLPAADTEPTVFAGGRYVFTNYGSTNTFLIRDQGGSDLVPGGLAPGETVELICWDAGDASGSWEAVFIDAAGPQEIYIPAAAMRPSVVGGCKNLNAISSGANQPDIVTLDFPDGADTFAQFSAAFPKNWNRYQVQAQFIWSHIAAADNRVVWGLQGVAVSDDDTIAANYSAVQQVADGASTGGTANDLYISAYTPVFQVAGGAQIGDMIFFRLGRYASSHASDAMASDARLHGIRFRLTTDHATAA